MPDMHPRCVSRDSRTLGFAGVNRVELSSINRIDQRSEFVRQHYTENHESLRRFDGIDRIGQIFI